MRASPFAASLASLALLSSCGGGGSGSGGSATPAPGASAPTPTPGPTSAPCSLISRAAAFDEIIDDWYVFPDLLARPSIASYTNLDDYIDARVAPARAQNKDRYFTYLTSIAEENAYYSSGASAGFGFRLAYDTSARRVFVAETFEDTPALGANIDRGSEILAIGTSPSTLQPVSSLMATGGPYAVLNALGASDPGVTRVLRVKDQSGITREVSLAKTDFALDPVSDRYGAKVIDDNGKKVGYFNLRTFIEPAIADMREAFAGFRDQGITEFIVDLRYNGGGALTVSEVLGDLLARDHVGEVYYNLSFRPSQSSLNETYRFASRAQSVAPTRIAFIGTDSTASASELVINGLEPYLKDRLALIGSNTYGKPVGQRAFDLTACDDRLRLLTFKIENAEGNGEYFDGLASSIPNTCRASDDLSYQLGDPREEMVVRALDFLAGRSCTPISAATDDAIASTGRTALGQRGLLTREQPQTTAEREVPGLF
ncbi:peptidase S41 [Aurantiacibacter xanthus]|uniref:Peptidase S41 n=1 Tax=Aurantiacibacter xanthus TaxID=1784712 RepID=A0A3A1P8P9_9SPHN|nr:S41 family peptidase [Aurantiacibacter xanthus]RIV89919.1 peptidase S41 [Aurantiacibacter xanthus]